jgi:general secretion pathway protein F
MEPVLAVYEYKGVNASGKSVTGIIDADSPRLARQKLRSEGVFPTEVAEERAQKGRLSQDVSFQNLFQRVSTQEISVMTRQLATLLRAGLPLVACLNALADQIDNPKLKKIITQIRERVNEGSALAAAMEEFPKVFPDLYVNMINAGEASGALELVLFRLAEYLEGQVRIRSRIRAALIYPAVMTVVGFGVLGVLFTFVVPKFVAIFEELDQALPLPTVILIGISDFVRAYWYVLLLLVGLAIYGLNRYRQTPKGREHYDMFLLKIPIFGKLIMLGVVIRFTRTLSTLLSSGVPLLKALDILTAIVNHAVFAKAIASARESVTEGASLSQPLRQSGIFPPIVIHMIASGEQSGELEDMLSKVAEIYEEEAETLASTLMSLLEPVLILSMAMVVSFIIISILLPLLEINQIVR